MSIDSSAAREGVEIKRKRAALSPRAIAARWLAGWHRGAAIAARIERRRTEVERRYRPGRRA